MPEFDVYEKVWVMEHNTPKKKIVYAVIHVMNYWKTGVEVQYQLVNSQISASEKNSITRSGKSMFPTKETLLGSL